MRKMTVQLDEVLLLKLLQFFGYVIHDDDATTANEEDDESLYDNQRYVHYLPSPPCHCRCKCKVFMTSLCTTTGGRNICHDNTLLTLPSHAMSFAMLTCKSLI